MESNFEETPVIIRFLRKSSWVPISRKNSPPAFVEELSVPSSATLPSCATVLINNLAPASVESESVPSNNIVLLFVGDGPEKHSLQQYCDSININENVKITEKAKQYKNNVIFGSFNNISKINKDVITVWSKILNKVNNSKLFLKNIHLEDDEIKNNLITAFALFGIKKDRLVLFGKSKDKKDVFKTYNQIDIILDTFPYPGITTSLEAIFMGVPLLTKNGSTFYSKIGASINKNLNMPDWIAKNDNEYIQKAIEKALSERDETAEPAKDAKGNLKADSDLRDNENIPVTQDIDEYFKNEVTKYVPDAWIVDETRSKIGYEIPFTRHFYVYTPLRPLEEIDKDLKENQKEISELQEKVLGV